MNIKPRACTELSRERGKIAAVRMSGTPATMRSQWLGALSEMCAAKSPDNLRSQQGDSRIPGGV